MRGNTIGFCLCLAESNMHDMPASDSFTCPIRKGTLHKLTNRGWFYSGSWKSRFCVLDGSKFYFYEKEQSRESEKNSGVLSLDYFDLCEESKSRDKKNPHVFVLGTSVKGLFENRHQFAAETSDEMQSWIQSIQKAIAEARKNRTKPGRKKLDGKSPDLSNLSQESDGASTTCLVNATKDRAKGPLGRRLPQRKSMMPQSRIDELEDIRQRSISLSSPQKSQDSEEPDEALNERLKPSSDSKWLSISMNDMERGSDDAFEAQRSSSAFDILGKGSPPQNDAELSSKPAQKKGGPRRGNLLGQHAALTKELEMKLKAGMTPGVKRQPSESEEDVHSKREAEDRRIEILSSKVDSTKEALDAIEEKVNLLIKKVEPVNEHHERAVSPITDVLREVTDSLQECKKTLSDVNEAKAEYENLVKECKEMLARLNNNYDHQNHEN